ncbi:helix-turn-helix transcriptional regulator [Saccharopolyspora sp. NFXS83]|uniref:helix-turn-helix transcriptional regulator n=1 Tax=Saccharopolyspora sp. NFXS83 TaxID=2993560 RepID=UPI00224AC419|nr:helix-turn-helix transcriptional regulator [Saccharopolyspora sp. NFXS83]MCX2731783.1 helix-turn-helix transcriptional regulator [Saccharopolyspora sp. NFXS83]
MSQIRHAPVAPTSTQFRDGGDTIDRHRHDDHQLIYVSSGVLAITTEHGCWIASRDRALWVPANTWHEHRFYGRSRFHTAGFPVGGGAPLLDAERPTVIAVDALVRELLIALTGTTLTRVETRHVEAVLRDRLRRVTAQPVVLPTARDRRLADACRLVEDDLRRPRTLAQLAGQVHTSERTLSRLYRDEFGMSFPQWRTRARTLTAMIMLAEGSSVTDTAHACGWATTSAFVHTFARSTGTTPGAYRAGVGTDAAP